MYPHRIRLRGPWEAEPVAESGAGAGSAARPVTLPCRWDDIRPGFTGAVVFRRRFVVMLSVIPVALFLFFESPVKMVVAGGIAQSAMLPVVGLGTLYLHHRHLPPEIAPSVFVTLGLWAASLIMLAAAGYGLVQGLR